MQEFIENIRHTNLCQEVPYLDEYVFYDARFFENTRFFEETYKIYFSAMVSPINGLPKCQPFIKLTHGQ